MLRLGETCDETSVVADQWGHPTSALDFADAILQTARILRDSRDFSRYGVYYLAETGDTSWNGIAPNDRARALGAPPTSTS